MVKLIDRLINKEYLTERERKEWLGHIKNYIEKLEKKNKELETDVLEEMYNYQDMARLYHAEVTEHEKTKAFVDILKRDDVVDRLTREFNELYTKYHTLKAEYEKTRYLLDLTIKEAKKNE